MGEFSPFIAFYVAPMSHSREERARRRCQLGPVVARAGTDARTDRWSLARLRTADDRQNHSNCARLPASPVSGAAKGNALDAAELVPFATFPLYPPRPDVGADIVEQPVSAITGCERSQQNLHLGTYSITSSARC
jgi:hypothetical protein